MKMDRRQFGKLIASIPLAGLFGFKKAEAKPLEVKKEKFWLVEWGTENHLIIPKRITNIRDDAVCEKITTEMILKAREDLHNGNNRILSDLPWVENPEKRTHTNFLT